MRLAAPGIALAISLAASPAAAQPFTPAFVAGPCDMPGVTAALASRLRCGTVAVLRQPGSQASGRFRLAVAILLTGSDRRRDDPVVYFAGGPGSPLTAKVAVLASYEAGVIAPDRDLILVDQRGSGRSEPSLCPGLASRQAALFAAGKDETALVDAWRASYAACRAEMAAAGLQPDWFGTQITADDMDQVRQALGVPRWTVYALSYGTAVAATLMALHPDSLRAVVLDSVLPPDPLPLTPSQTFDRALRLLFAGCQGDAACAAAHPDLPRSYDAAQRGLDADAMDVPLPSGSGLQTARLRGEVFRLIVNRALYSRTGMASLPAFIEAARDRDAAAMAGLVASAVRGYRDLSMGIMAAVECRDRPGWQGPAPTPPAGAPVSAFVPGMCVGWGPLGPPPLLPGAMQVPTLVLAGMADPITPPAFAQIVADTLGHEATLVEFAHIGHGVQQSSPCAERLVTAFIGDPARPADAACAGHVPQVTFH